MCQINALPMGELDRRFAELVGQKAGGPSARPHSSGAAPYAQVHFYFVFIMYVFFFLGHANRLSKRAQLAPPMFIPTRQRSPEVVTVEEMMGNCIIPLFVLLYH